MGLKGEQQGIVCQKVAIGLRVSAIVLWGSRSQLRSICGQQGSGSKTQ